MDGGAAAEGALWGESSEKLEVCARAVERDILQNIARRQCYILDIQELLASRSALQGEHSRLSCRVEDLLRQRREQELSRKISRASCGDELSLVGEILQMYSQAVRFGLAEEDGGEEISRKVFSRRRLLSWPA
eukprot:TRINITY_DN195030_c0_g1_i1.p1 TRINITY_DN195030_c0_g1~~TRINITY_DN195030_c0_g1_i1.p1  ORF type:complete len:133 (+),score=8.06 TRINITY_DN195030_c0_g1_i1:49-447(+)